ncbi:MAG TPA: CYCXC family (seleno)protein [Acidobacteriaceae bacterium]|nr:CYCXC family (seleno)protein [Acidobacteriaceae bacterium]
MLKRVLASLAVALLVAALYSIPVSIMPSHAVHAQWTDPQADIPAFHGQAPAKGEALPPILAGPQLTGPFFREKWQVEVYHEAARIPRVLYQLPCYCRCDRALGHTSLHSCFASTHGAICSTCAKEGAYAYEKTKQGWTPQQIRAGIEHKEFESIDLDSLGRS